jgi:hypothetical protein
MNPQTPTLKGDSDRRGRRPDVKGEGEWAMSDVFDEILDDELTEDDLDELEALGAAEDAEFLLGKSDA